MGHGFECSGTNFIAFVCGNTPLHGCVCVHGTGLALCLVQNRVGLGLGRSLIEFHRVK